MQTSEPSIESSVLPINGVSTMYNNFSVQFFGREKERKRQREEERKRER